MRCSCQAPSTRCTTATCARADTPPRSVRVHACERVRACRQLLEAARSHAGTGSPALFELCVRNPDKGAISAQEAVARLAPFTALGLPVVLTDTPRFTDKARLFRHARFVVGFDTAARLVLPKYYGDSEAQMGADFAALAAAGCGFVVAGRVDADGRFRSLADIAVPAILQHVGVRFEAISEAEFRMDVSSSEIRRSMALSD
jgi:hypothetical protein